MRIKLDDDQESVANHYGRNMLVLAGAGSGKTATVIERGARLVESGFDPRAILMMTFTNKAAKEMKERMIARFTEARIQQEIPNITTYHQFGFRMIKKYAHLLGMNEVMPTILSPTDAKNEWVNAFLEAGFHKDRLKETSMSDLPDIMSNAGVILESTDESIESAMAFFSEIGLYDDAFPLIEALINYDEFKNSQNVLDFNDMILLPIKILRAYPDIANNISSFLKDVVIDESQDNNQSQYELLKLITGTGKVPTMMIGDGDQAIYEWRGAKPGNLKNFLNDFKASQTVLEMNYRSHSDIVTGAQALVGHNVNRIEKSAYSSANREDTINTDSFKRAKPLSSSIAYSQSQHIGDLGDELAKHLKNSGKALADTAILYRSQRIGVLLEKALREHGIQTHMMAGTGLMDRKESLLALSALRLAANPFDRSAFKRLSTVIKGFGATSVDAVLEQAKDSRLSLISGEFKGLKKAQQMGLETIRGMVSELTSPEMILDWSKAHLSEQLIKEADTKIKTDIKSGKIPDDKTDEESLTMKRYALYDGYMENIESIHSSIVRQIDEKDYQDNIWEVITDLSLDAPQGDGQLNEGVKLSTIHSFKGLEADEVHVVGFTDGIMPFKDKEDRIGNPEEERRLAYVAITRAKTSLYLHHLKNYDIITGGKGYYAESMDESPYLNEVLSVSLERVNGLNSMSR